MTDIVNAENIAIEAETGEVKETAADDKIETTAYTVDYVFKMIEDIAKNTEHINKALDKLSDITYGDGVGDIVLQQKADAIARAVEAREQTNRNLIEFYTMVYEDLRPKDKKLVDYRESAIRAIHESMRINPGCDFAKCVAALKELCE